ncbi:MAG: hypothetical protein INR73_04205 [Williamsia sp.]|nr:hypothetical protein [Williamsia sp.]
MIEKKTGNAIGKNLRVAGRAPAFFYIMAQEEIKRSSKIIQRTEVLLKRRNNRAGLEQVKSGYNQQINMTVDGAFVQARQIGKSMRTNSYAILVIGQHVMEIGLWCCGHKKQQQQKK